MGQPKYECIKMYKWNLEEVQVDHNANGLENDVEIYERRHP